MTSQDAEHAPVAPGGRSVIAVSVLVVTCNVLPVFMVGAMSDPIRAELGFGESRLGIAVALFFLTSAVVSGVAGPLVERLGATWSMRLSCATGALGLLWMALLAQSWGGLVIGLVIASGALAIGTPAANLALAQGVAGRRMGLAFGLKQSSAPTGTLLAGAAVPILAVTVGWRPALLAGVAFTAVVVLLIPNLGNPPARITSRPSGSRGRVRSRPTILLTMGTAFALGNIAANSVGVFLVPSAVASGVDIGTAGVLLSLGSVAGIVSRVLVGWRADRGGDAPFRSIAIMLLIGGAAYGLLSLGEPVLVLPGAVLGFAFGWGWNGLFSYGVVHENPLAPAVATGVTHVGGYLGAALGPLMFGWLAEFRGYSAAWLLTAAAASAGAGAMYLAHRLTLRQASQPEQAPRAQWGA